MFSQVEYLLYLPNTQLPTALPSVFTVSHAAEVAFPPSVDCEPFASSVTINNPNRTSSM